MAARLVQTNGVGLHVLDEGEGPLVVLCHGFPELAYSWRHQVPALVGAGFRVLVPDMRGFGASSAPEDVEVVSAGTMFPPLVRNVQLPDGCLSRLTEIAPPEVSAYAVAPEKPSTEMFPPEVLTDNVPVQPETSMFPPEVSAWADAPE